MKVLNVIKEITEDRYEYILTGNCPICGRPVRKDAKGDDEECCGEILDWDVKEDKRTLNAQVSDLWDWRDWIDE